MKCIAESGVSLAMTLLYGRAPRRERVIDAVPQNYGQNVTTLGALSIQGIEAVMTVDSATDVDVFLTAIEHLLAPTMKLGDMIVMVNLRTHKVAGVQQAIKDRGARLIDLPSRFAGSVTIEQW